MKLKIELEVHLPQQGVAGSLDKTVLDDYFKDDDFLWRVTRIQPGERLRLFNPHDNPHDPTEAIGWMSLEDK